MSKYRYVISDNAGVIEGSDAKYKTPKDALKRAREYLENDLEWTDISSLPTKMQISIHKGNASWVDSYYANQVFTTSFIRPKILLALPARALLEVGEWKK